MGGRRHRRMELRSQNNRMRDGQRGFTLIELLVVMAITAILLGLIFGPMIQGFNLTNRARVQVLTQDSARAAMEIAQRDMSNAVYIFHQIPTSNQLLSGEPPEANSIS